MRSKQAIHWNKPRISIDVELTDNTLKIPIILFAVFKNGSFSMEFLFKGAKIRFLEIENAFYEIKIKHHSGISMLVGGWIQGPTEGQGIWQCSNRFQKRASTIFTYKPGSFSQIL